MAFLFSCAEKGEVEAADIIACKTFDPATHICDKRDGNLYKIKRMPDSRYWMAENLKYKPPHDLSKCYREEEENCKFYGRLYSWSILKELCPDGWRVPYDEEWDNLILRSGGENSDRKLKANYGWSNNGNGEDSYEFEVLPAGVYMIGRLEDGETCEMYDDGILTLNPWDGLGEITVFMSIGESADQVIASNADGKFKFCWAESSFKSVRCIKE